MARLVLTPYAMRLTLALVLVNALASLACASWFESDGCTDAGCITGVSAALDVAGARADIAGSKVVVCRNGQCEEGVLEATLGTDGEPVTDETPLRCRFTNAAAPGRGPTCFARGGQAAVVLDFSYGLANDEANDGDRYEFRVVDKATSQTTVRKEGSVTFRMLQPNGPECAPTCKQATLN